MRPVRVLSYVRSCLDKLIKICVKIITKPMAVQFHCHVSPSVSCDIAMSNQYTFFKRALPLYD